MKPKQRPPDGRAAKTGPPGFYELAKAHVAAHGGEWFVADKHKTPQQWRAWIAYFAWLDDQTTPRGRKAPTFGTLEKLTVPTEWPIGFDASAPPAPLPEPPRQFRPSAASSSPTCCVQLWPSTN
jgi:hypothetical protein